MNGMIGADPDALERLAGDFDRGAGSLESIVIRVRTSVHANPWAGARATRFRSDWDQRHGPQLKRTATMLRTAATQLRQQAAEQRRASSAGGGSPTGQVGRGGGPSGDRAVPTSPFGIWDDLQDQFKGELAVLGILGATSALGKNAQLVGRYPRGWEDLIRKTGDLRLPKGIGPKDFGPKAADFLKYKRSFNGMFSVNGLGDKLDNIPGLGKLGTFMGGVGLATEAAALATNPSPLGVSKTVAAAMKTSKHPMAYLGGVALSSVNMAAEEAQKTDWSPEALKTTTDFVRANGPGVVVDELGKAAKEVLINRVWKIF